MSKYLLAMRVMATLLLVCFSLVLFPKRGISQKIDNAKVDKAAERSSLAAEILTYTSKLKGDTIPRDLLTNAKAIGVFPDFRSISIVMPKSRISYGVISRRLPNGWSPPVYYGFGFREQPNLKAQGNKNPDMIVLFMTDKSIEALLKGRIPLMKDMLGVAGPVGTASQRNNEANVFTYTIIDGKVNGLAVDANDEGGILNPDNNINEAIYGMKAQDVLAGKGAITPLVLAAVTAYPNALSNLQKEK
ncbi:MAG: lipid-binding SYLF domain-containing protein [Acidobacteria bacterium]|nr:lipid-binding SYLF domain-containing protein [Acidobacteriota bacterium]